MNQLENIADRTYVINLAHRKDRWESAKQQLDAIGYESYKRFDAYGVNNPPPPRYHEGIEGFKMSGWWGNKFSHYGVIDLANSLQYDAVMIFEDDIMLHPHFNLVVSLAMEQLEGIGWDWLQLGGNHRNISENPHGISIVDGKPFEDYSAGIEYVTQNLAKINRMLTAHAYLVKKAVFPFILKHAIASPLSIDGFYAYEVHPRFRCYTVVPYIASQVPGINDIDGSYSNYLFYIGD